MKKRGCKEDVIIVQNNKKFNETTLNTLNKKRIDIISNVVYKIFSNKLSLS